jgi:hypothetical protein
MQGSREVSAADLQHNHAAHQFYIAAARHALKYAPLPEFEGAIEVLEQYDASPDGCEGEDTRGWIEDVCTELKSDELTRRDYGYTAIGQFYAGLLHIFELVLSGPEIVSLSDPYLFAEAAYCAARALGADAEEVQRRESYFQNKLWDELI